MPQIAMHLDTILAPVAADFAAVEQALHGNRHSGIELVNQVSEHIISNGGKRLRPLVLLLSAHACGYQKEAHITLGCVLEFIHTATLLHDDVIDKSELRRSKSTANRLWGNAASILVGDFLYSRAFQLLVDTNNMAIMAVLTKATTLISEGEALQLMNRHNPDMTEEDYLAIISYKTGKLFEVAAHLGAILAQTPAEQAQALQNYGMHLGIAFQLIDDVLDFTGSAEQMGKNIGDDLAEGSPTLPIIYAMAHNDAAQTAYIRQAIETGNREPIAIIKEAIDLTGAIAYTSAIAQQEGEKALLALKNIPESPYKTSLVNLVTFALHRHH